MTWQAALRDLIGGYFGDQTIDEGVKEMVSVTECNPEYHQLYVSALEEGLKAALSGSSEVVDILRDSFIWDVRDTKSAQEFLERLLGEYNTQYQAVSGNESPPAPTESK